MKEGRLQPSPPSLEERVQSLEQDVKPGKRLKRYLLMGVVMGVVALLLLAPTHDLMHEGEDQPGDVIRANKIVLVDEEGGDRAVLGVDQEGPRLVLLGKDGTIRALFGATDDKGVLSFLDSDGSDSRLMLLASEEATGFSLYDKDGNGRIGATIDNEGAQLTVHDRSGRSAGLAGGTPMIGGVGFVVADDEGTLRLGAGMTQEGAGLLVYDKEGRIVWSAP